MKHLPALVLEQITGRIQRIPECFATFYIWWSVAAGLRNSNTSRSIFAFHELKEVPRILCIAKCFA